MHYFLQEGSLCCLLNLKEYCFSCQEVSTCCPTGWNCTCYTSQVWMDSGRQIKAKKWGAINTTPCWFLICPPPHPNLCHIPLLPGPNLLPPISLLPSLVQTFWCYGLWMDSLSAAASTCWLRQQPRCMKQFAAFCNTHKGSCAAGKLIPTTQCLIRSGPSSVPDT